MSEQIIVQDVPDRRRYEVRVDGTLAGTSHYLDTEVEGAAQRIFFHTAIKDAFEGRGLASTLTREALRETVDAGRRIVPVCPYVERWLTTHDEVAGAVDAVTPHHQALLERRG